MSRQVNLLLALADDPSRISYQWIYHNVDGYRSVKRESAERYLRADVEALTKLGVPIEQDAHGLLLLDDFAEYSFSEAEANALATAANAKFNSQGLAELAQSGWRKLAASAHRASLDYDEVLVTDPIDFAEGDFAALIEALTPPRNQVRFWYVPQYGADDIQRNFEPWQIIALRGRFYVIGYDIDRQATRLFRLTRVRDVEITDATAAQPMPDGDLQELAERVLHRHCPMVKPVVRMLDNPGATVELDEMQEREAVEMALRDAGSLIVVEPASLRDEVIRRLREIVKARETGTEADG